MYTVPTLYVVTWNYFLLQKQNVLHVGDEKLEHTWVSLPISWLDHFFYRYPTSAKCSLSSFYTYSLGE